MNKKQRKILKFQSLNLIILPVIPVSNKKCWPYMVHFQKRQGGYFSNTGKTWHCLQESLRTNTPLPIWSTAPLTNLMCHALPHLQNLACAHASTWGILPSLAHSGPPLPLANFYSSFKSQLKHDFFLDHLSRCPWEQKHSVIAFPCPSVFTPTSHLVLCSFERKVLSGQGACLVYHHTESFNHKPGTLKALSQVS